MSYPKKKYQVLLLVNIEEDNVYEIHKEVNFIVETLNDVHRDKMQTKIKRIEEVKKEL